MNRIVLCLALALAAGCGSSPVTRFYTLQPLAGSAPAPVSIVGAIHVSVGLGAVPEAVDRPQIVLRTDETRVEIAEFHRWAEPLKYAIPRVIARDLGEILGIAYLVEAGGGAGIAPDVRITVDIQRFDAIRNERVVIDALWKAMPQKGEPRTGRSQVSEPITGADYDGVARAYTRALAAVSAEIAASLRTPPRAIANR
jgi:uncharacterized lipoprotein YmbA